nr:MULTISPECIES: S1 family peptidase [unclassified Corynebacterium]
MTRVADSVDQHGRRHGDPVVLTGVRDYPDLGEDEVSFDNFGQPICKDGAASGRTCGIQFMRTRHSLWSSSLALPGDSGGVNFDPTTGEALGASTQSMLGLLMTTQPFDVALEEAYGIPDGQVNEHFSLPESTEAHDPMLTVKEHKQRVADWAEREIPEEMKKPAEPVTMADAEQIAIANTMYAAGELRIQTQDALSILAEDPTSVDAVADNVATGVEILGNLAQETASAYDEALASLALGED